MRETEKEDILESIKKRKRNKLIISFSIVFAIIIIFLVLGVLAYKYFQSPEYELELGADIEEFLISEDDNYGYVRLRAGSNDENKSITKVKLIFSDVNGNEYVYETEQGLRNISVPYKKGILDFFKGPEFRGGYNYNVSVDDVSGLESFENVKRVEVVFEYEKERGEVVESPVLDTKKPTAPVKRSGGSGGGGGGGGGGGSGDGGDNGACVPSKTCADYSGCGTGLSDGCESVLDCSENCGSGEVCVNGSCVDVCIPDCAGKQCGGDGCGNSCGSCGTGYYCDNGQCSVITGNIIFVDNQLTTDCVGTYSIANRDCSGSDGDAYDTPQEAADVVNPGDVVYFREGVYYQHEDLRDMAVVMNILRNGTFNSPIIFTNYNNEKAVLSGMRPGDYGHYYILTLGTSPSTSENISGSGVHDIIIDGLIIEGAERVGLMVYGPANKYETAENPTKNIIIRNVISRNHAGLNAQGRGISTRGKLVNVLIEDCEAYNNTGGGIGFGRIEKEWHLPEPESDMSAAQHSTIRNCLVYNNVHPLFPGNTDGMGGSHMYNVTIEGNIVFGNSDDGMDIYASIETIVKNNIIFGHSYPGGNNAGLKFSAGGGGRHTIAGNVVLNNDGFTFESSNPSNRLREYYPSKVYNNLGYNGVTGFSLGSTYNLTYSGFEKVHLRNNLALDNSAHDIYYGFSASTDSDYNFFSNTEDYNRMQGNGMDVNSLTGDPGLVNKNVVIDTNFGSDWTLQQKMDYIRSQVKNAFSLTNESQLIDTGTIIPDYHCSTYGNHPGENCREWYGNAPDIGAYEFREGECFQDLDCEYRGPGFICNTGNECEWKPPIGIPKPSFGIEETYRMYDNPANRNPELTYTQNAEGGYYTHYVDNTHPEATDSGNPYGTEQRPRNTIPLDLSAGSVVEIHGGPYFGGDGITITSSGTNMLPVFVRGIGNPVVIPGGIYGWQTLFNLRGSYVIVENFEFDRSPVRLGGNGYHHLALRNSDVHGADATSIAPQGDNIVIYNVSAHDTGTWNTAYTDTDYHGVKIGSGTNITIVDNEFYHLAGDGIQVGGGDGVVGEELTIDVENIFVGRNVVYENTQVGFAVKTARNVVFSQNTIWNFRSSDITRGSGDVGGPFGYALYDLFRANDIWYIFNEIHNSDGGIIDSGTLGPVYAIGNVVYDSDGGIGGSGPNRYVYQNTIFNAGTAGSFVDGANNLIANQGDSDLDQLFFDVSNHDFRLQSTSPAVDNAIHDQNFEDILDLYESTFGVSIRKDIEARTRPIDGDNNGSAEWDIGAYEFEISSGGFGTQSVSSSKGNSVFSFIWNWIKGLLHECCLKD